MLGAVQIIWWVVRRHRWLWRGASRWIGEDLRPHAWNHATFLLKAFQAKYAQQRAYGSVSQMLYVQSHAFRGHMVSPNRLTLSDAGKPIR